MPRHWLCRLRAGRSWASHSTLSVCSSVHWSGWQHCPQAVVRVAWHSAGCTKCSRSASQQGAVGRLSPQAQAFGTGPDGIASESE